MCKSIHSLLIVAVASAVVLASGCSSHTDASASAYGSLLLPMAPHLTGSESNEILAYYAAAAHTGANIAFSGLVEKNGEVVEVIAFAGPSSRKAECASGEFVALKKVNPGDHSVWGCWQPIADGNNYDVSVRWFDGTAQHWPIDEIPHVMRNLDFVE